jgi:shikimate kinase
MGAGKSTVGRLIAARRGVPFVDLDAAIGDIPAIFAAEGESGFRSRERAALASAAAGDGVLALGGGALVSEENRALLADWTIVVLMADAATLRQRIGADPGRPLQGQLERLLVERGPSWRAAGTEVWTAGLSPADVADQVEALCGSP